MSDILKELYELLDDGERTPEYDQAARRAEPWERRLRELTQNLGECDAIWKAAADIGSADQPVWFARGFRLGARLMLAVLEDASAL